MMMSNPAAMLAQVINRGGNPQQLLRQMAASNPQISQALQMMQNKTPQQLEQMARNMARERGVNVEDVARSLGIFAK